MGAYEFSAASAFEDQSGPGVVVLTRGWVFSTLHRQNENTSDGRNIVDYVGIARL